MTEITKNNCVYKTHPIFNLYAGSKDGRIIHIVKQVPYKGNRNKYGYRQIKVRRYGESKQKNFMAHKFIWECFNGVIPEGKVIDHKNDDKEDNRLCNLDLMTQQQNCKKAVKNRATFNTHQNIRSVKAINKKTKEISYYWSMYSANQHLNINSKQIQDVCDGIIKSTQSKKDNHWYKFEYVEKNLPVNYIKSKNIRPRKKTDKQIKERIKNYQTKDWKCPKCDKVLRNNSKYRHIKKCPK